MRMSRANSYFHQQGKYLSRLGWCGGFAGGIAQGVPEGRLRVVFDRMHLVVFPQELSRCIVGANGVGVRCVGNKTRISVVCICSCIDFCTTSVHTIPRDPYVV